MKTLKLKLKKDVLIVDTNAPIQAIEIDDYVFLCKGSELTEEIASELVEQSYSNLEESIMYRDYMAKYDDEVLYEALDSFKSAIESKGFYWLENPIKKSYYNLHKGIYEYEPTIQNLQRVKNIEQWQEAEEKTFRNPLIFVNK